MLAERAFDGKLDLYLGAGVSKGSPTGLPLGGELFDRVRYVVMAEFPDRFDPDDPRTSLEALGSAIHGDAVREARFKRLLLEAADFTTEDANYSHRAVALLLLLGLATVMSANWDDCIERAALELRGKVVPTVTDEDRRRFEWHRRFHKVHGCANCVDSLLVRTEDLANPPDWVATAVGSDIGAETFVFIGLATVGDYVRTRIKQVLSSAPVNLDVEVVVPNEKLSDGWKELLGEHAEDHHLRARADDFLDELLRAVWRLAVTNVRLEAEKLAADLAPGAAEDQRNRLDALVDALGQADALRLLRWWTDGADLGRKTTTLKSSDARMQLLAIASLVQAPPEVHLAEDAASVCLEDCYVELAFADGGPGSALQRRQDGRIARRAARGAYPKRDRPVLVLHEGAGTAVPVRSRDVAKREPADAGDLVEGAEGPDILYRGWMDILQGKVPRQDLLAA